MPILNDFLLNRSTPINLAQSQEQEADLTLQPNPNLNSATVAGFVRAAGVPVPNATVKLLTPSGSPVAHATTTAEGFYSIVFVPPASYQVVGIAPGFAVSVPTFVTLPPRQTLQVDISLTADPRTQLSNLYGLVIDTVSGGRISTAQVTLTASDESISAVTISNSDGQYLLCALSNGSYSISAAKTGYEAESPIPVTLTEPSIVNQDLLLEPTIVAHGTVSGFIRDPSGAALANAVVALYTVTGTTETLGRGTHPDQKELERLY